MASYYEDRGGLNENFADGVRREVALQGEGRKTDRRFSFVLIKVDADPTGSRPATR